MVKRRRGFTLIELLVGSAVALTVLAVAFAAFVRTTAMHRRQVELAEMKRAAALVLGQLGAELRQAGLGRPRHGCAEGSGVLFPPTFLVAQEDQLAFLTDLPRRDSNFNGYSQLADDQSTGLPTNGIALLNELNGGCDISSATGHCSSSEESLLFPPGAGIDCSSSAASPTCPWGLNRYQGNEFLIVANTKGNWVERQLLPSLHAEVSGGRRTLVLKDSLPPDFFSGANRGFVSTPDRVYYGLDASGVRRNQCWGSIFSSPGGSTFGLGCPDTFASNATGWEVLTTSVAPNGLRFSYWSASGTLLPVPVTDAADLRGIRRVDIELALERKLPDGETLSHFASLSITLRQ